MLRRLVLFGLLIAFAGATEVWALDESPLPPPQEKRPSDSHDDNTPWNKNATLLELKKEEALPRSGNRLYIGAGFAFPDFFRTGRDAADGSRSGSDMSLLLQLTGAWHIAPNWLLGGLIGWNVDPRDSSDGGSSRRYTPLVAQITKVYDSWEPRGGLGVVFYTIKGNGGPVNLSNGSGTTTFAYPSTTTTSSYLLFDFGIGKRVGNMAGNIDFFLSDLFGPKASSDLVLSFGYNVI